MLETLREYASERLRTADEELDAHIRHLAFFLAQAEAAEPALHGKSQASVADRLERDHGNPRAALSWSLHGDRVVAGLRLAAALRYFWKMHGHHREGRYWPQALVDASSRVVSPELQGRALGA
jgi:predicted ATPase